MTSPFTQHLCTALLGAVILSSCSRPVAYFQRIAVEPVKTATIATPTQVGTIPTELFTRANTTITELDAYVRNDGKLATDKKLSKRMDRVKNLLASSHGTLEPKGARAPHRITLVERLILKKINKKIARQQSPNHPEKALSNPVLLIGGIVLLIVGLLLLILGTGTTAFIGLIIALAGALGTILGLFGQ